MRENEADSATAEGTDNENGDYENTGTETGENRETGSEAGETTGSGKAEPVTARSRRGKRPAGPPPDVEDASAAEAAPPAGEEEPPKKAVRTRTRARSGKAAETPEPVPMTGAETSPDTESVPVAAEEERPADEAPAPRTRTRRRGSAASTAASSAGADVPGAATAPAVPSVPEVPSPGTEVPAEQVSDTEPASGVGVPGVTFQPPMVVFQPPQPKAESPARPADEPKRAAEPADQDAADEEPVDGPPDDDDSDDRPSRRRRRRGGRGRGRGGKEGAEDESPAETDEPEDEPKDEQPAKSAAKKDGAAKDGAAKKDKAKRDKPAAKGKEKEPKAERESEQEAADDEADDEAGSSRRRRRRRRRTGADGEGPATADDPPNTVVHVRSTRAAETRTSDDEVQSVRGSTRLEAKKQRRREGREQGRRRPPVITEAEFLARREAVDRVMVVRQEGERTQIAVLEDGVLVEHYVNRATHQSYVGNVYLGKVQNVLPSMEAAFVDIGKGRNAVLYAGEVNWDASGLEGQPRRIESALKSGQSVLVQVTKDPLGHKGARLTSQVSLPGRYLVYVPDGSMTGISRKLPDKERSRLKSILKKVMPQNAGVIVRTAAEGATEEELSRDVSRLAAQWDSIQKKVKSAATPSLLYGEPDLTIRVVRDIFNEDFTKLVVSGAEAWDTISEYVEYVAPHLADRVERWTGDQDALSAFRIDEQIAKALDRKVWLPSGGSLVIDRTEAMTVIDVNTGKFTGQGGNLEETVTRNNLEAAEEIVRQLRLRDIGGIVVIDFIDMVLESNRDLVLRRLVECLSRDRTKHQVAEVTSLGLVQMTRKRVGQGLLEAFSETCESCNGRGIHVHLTPVEPKADKAAGKESGRRRKRKGEVEKTVEEKLARHETARPVPAAAAAPKSGSKAEPKPEPEPEPAPAVEPEPEPVRSRSRRSGPAKRPAGPPPEIDADESPAQAAVEAADAAADVTEAPPGILESLDSTDPVTTIANGAAPAADAATADPAVLEPSVQEPNAQDPSGPDLNGPDLNGSDLNGADPASAEPGSTGPAAHRTVHSAETEAE